MEGDSPGECGDCGKQFTYSKKRMETHSEYLKKHRCPEFRTDLRIKFRNLIE